MAARKRRGAGKKLHQTLRRRMKSAGLSGRDLACRLGCCPGTFSEKLNGHIPWQSWEMHTLMDALAAQPEEMYELFPPNGEDIPPLREVKIAAYLAERNETAVSTPVLETMLDIVHRLVPGAHA